MGDLPRRRVLVLAVTAALLVPAGAFALFTHHRHPTVAGTATCVNKADVYYDTDAQMQTAAASLRNDPRVMAVTTDTKAQSYAHFREIFADQPKLLDEVGPDDLPAAVHVDLVGSYDVTTFIVDVKHTTAANDVRPRPCTIEPQPTPSR